MYNGQADSTTLNQIATQLLDDGVDVIVPIATPAAQIVQAATEDNQIPVVFSAVSDPVGAGLAESMDAPGANITGTSDALNTNAILDLMFAANPDIKKVGLLYSQSEDSSKKPIEDAKAYLDEKGIEYVEKTGTNNTEVTQAADALIAAGVDAVFTPTDNTVMTAELAIYEKFIDAGIPHYCWRGFLRAERCILRLWRRLRKARCSRQRIWSSKYCRVQIRRPHRSRPLTMELQQSTLRQQKHLALTTADSQNCAPES